VSQEDIDGAVQDLLASIVADAVPSGRITDAKVLSKEIVSQEASAKVGDEVTEFTLKLKVKIVGVVFDAEPIKEFSKKVLESVTPEGQILSTIDTDSIQYVVEKYDTNAKIAQLVGTVHGSLVLDEGNIILDKERIIDLSVDQVAAYLEGFESVESVDVRLFPSWIKRIPELPDHVIIKVITE
jgi:hypothetical protein